MVGKHLNESFSSPKRQKGKIEREKCVSGEKQYGFYFTSQCVREGALNSSVVSPFQFFLFSNFPSILVAHTLFYTTEFFTQTPLHAERTKYRYKITQHSVYLMSKFFLFNFLRNWREKKEVCDVCVFFWQIIFLHLLCVLFHFFPQKIWKRKSEKNFFLITETKTKRNFDRW